MFQCVAELFTGAKKNVASPSQADILIGFEKLCRGRDFEDLPRLDFCSVRCEPWRVGTFHGFCVGSAL